MRLRGMMWAMLVAAGPAAAETPSFDCAKAGSDAERLICGDAELAVLDRRLAETYGAALAAAQGLDAGAEAAEDELKAFQRGWIKGRDECWKSDDLRTCVLDAYLGREADLVARWQLQPASAEAAWRCEDGGEAFVSYYETEVPGIRIEYGDSVETMQQSRAASGARYDGMFGRYFWETGGEATLSWDGATEQTCVLAAG